MAIAAGTLAAATARLSAQTAGKVYRLGYLAQLPWSMASKLVGPYFPTLAAEGFVEGRNLVVDARTAEGRLERLRALAGEIVAGRPDLTSRRAHRQWRRSGC